MTNGLTTLEEWSTKIEEEQKAWIKVSKEALTEIIRDIFTQDEAIQNIGFSFRASEWDDQGMSQGVNSVGVNVATQDDELYDWIYDGGSINSQTDELYKALKIIGEQNLEAIFNESECVVIATKEDDTVDYTVHYVGY